MRHPSSGFTLLELLIVMGIIAILAVAMSVAFFSSSSGARDTARKTAVRSLAEKAEEYFKDKQGYPHGLADLTAGGYLTTLPKDPKTKADYTYTPAPAGCAAGACTTYTVSASLENTKDASYPTFALTNSQ